ncbi:MAG: Gfo/Idh/MocA family oxidoreductase [Chloroflexota bacterium]|nr:Gfo/Idh/MocA family oxidoreductase [Chloroflexota bacterium]
MTSPMKVGLIGCGTISGAYLRSGRAFEVMEVVACSDIILERAQARAAEFGVPKACTPEELLQDPEIEIVVNLTIPAVHAEVSIAALQAGKHVYSEKPLAIELEDGRKVLEAALERGLRVGCAPDTFLGGGQQTCRKLVDDGVIGEPVGASAFMLSHGPENWHPDPAFLYAHGAGPLFDMGPYYLTAMANLIGPIRRITGSTRITFPERTITSQPRYGEQIVVDAPTYIAGVLDFQNGAIGTMITTFDVWASQLPRIEIYGTKGTLSVPDPNTFGGPVRMKLEGDEDWREVPLTHGYTKQGRGLGVADMAQAIRSGRPHRASGELAYQVLEAMHAFVTASDEGRHVELSSRGDRPAPLPVGLPAGVLDS